MWPPAWIGWRPGLMSSYVCIKARARPERRACSRAKDPSKSIGELLGCVVNLHASHLRARDCKYATGDNDDSQNCQRRRNRIGIGEQQREQARHTRRKWNLHRAERFEVIDHAELLKQSREKRIKPFPEQNRCRGNDGISE